MRKAILISGFFSLFLGASVAARNTSGRRAEFGENRLSEPRHHHHRTVGRGRSERHALAHDRRRHVTHAGPENLGREYRWSGRNHRFLARKASYARRVHSSDRKYGHSPAAVALYPKLAYDPRSDFDPIGILVSAPIVIVGRRDFPPKDLKEFIAYVQANAHKLDEGHGGVASIPFTACLLLNHMIGAKPRLVGYDGASPAMEALIRGRIDYMCDQTINAVPPVRGGRVKAYAIAARSAALLCRMSRPQKKAVCRNTSCLPGKRCSFRREFRKSLWIRSTMLWFVRWTMRPCAINCEIWEAISLIENSAPRKRSPIL